MSSISTILETFDAVCFDLDHTLVRWGGALSVFGKLVRHNAMGMLQLQKEVEKNRGLRSLELNAHIMSALSRRTNPASLAELDQRWSLCYSPRQRVDSMLDLIEQLDAQGIPRALISDYPAIEKLRRIGLAEGWSAVVSCRDLGALKPLADGLQTAMAQLGSIPAKTLYIGDRWETDGLAAMAAGCSFIHVSAFDGAWD